MTKDQPEQIDAELTIEEIIRRCPRAAAVFIKRGMNCVGCDVARFETLAEACQIYGQAREPLLAELRSLTDVEGTAAGGHGGDRSFEHEPPAR